MHPPVPTWYRIRLSREEIESGELDLVQGLFRAGFVARYGPSGAAAFGGWEEHGASFCVYFTPAAETCAAALFKTYQAERCAAPDRRRVEWLSGDADAHVAFSLMA